MKEKCKLIEGVFIVVYFDKFFCYCNVLEVKKEIYVFL